MSASPSYVNQNALQPDAPQVTSVHRYRFPRSTTPGNALRLVLTTGERRRFDDLANDTGARSTGIAETQASTTETLPVPPATAASLVTYPGVSSRGGAGRC
jgi:hypothetical protein